MPIRVVLSAVALAGVLVGVAMVLLGLPETTPAQSVLLELSALPLSISVAAGIGILHSTADRPVGRRSRVVLSYATGAVVFGLVLMVWAYVYGPRDLVHTGQVLVWLGLMASLLVMIRRQPRRRATHLSLHDPDEQTPDDNAPPDRDHTTSL